MEKNILNNYVLDLLESVEQNLSSYMNVKESEYLHHLRVDIKKINAILSFAEKIYNAKYDVTLLKPLFQKAGKIREMQINLHLLNAIPLLPERLTAKLKKKENILSQQFIKSGSLYKMLIKNFRENLCLPELLPSKKTIIKYLKKEGIKAEIILQNIDREKLHRYRKKIKKIMYIYNALPKRMQKKIELNEAKINKQQEKLGEWHDTYTAINIFSHEHFSRQTSEYILKLKEKEERQFNTLLITLTNKCK